MFWLLVVGLCALVVGCRFICFGCWFWVNVSWLLVLGLEDDIEDRRGNERYDYEDDLIEDDFIDDADGLAGGR